LCCHINGPKGTGAGEQVIDLPFLFQFNRDSHVFSVSGAREMQGIDGSGRHKAEQIRPNVPVMFAKGLISVAVSSGIRP